MQLTRCKPLDAPCASTESRDARRAGYWICLSNLDSKSAAVPAAPTLALLSFPSLENLSYLVVKKRSLQ